MPIKITDIKPNPANPRIHDMAGKLDALVRSLLVFPKMLQLREIVVAGKKGKPITQGGNMRLKAIQRIVEMPWEEIEAAQQEITGQDERIAANLEFWKEVRDGKSLPDWCVKYAEDFTDGELREFVIKDNVGFGEWDWDVLRVDYDAEGLVNWGLDVPEDWMEEAGAEESKNPYSSNVKAPTYEPKNEKPEIEALYNSDKYSNLVAEIDNSSLPDSEKGFLKVAASRHIVFHYENIADFYAHASEECQLLMESSALVIIDFDKAIEHGYIELREEIANLYGQEYGDEE